MTYNTGCKYIFPLFFQTIISLHNLLFNIMINFGISNTCDYTPLDDQSAFRRFLKLQFSRLREVNIMTNPYFKMFNRSRSKSTLCYFWCNQRVCSTRIVIMSMTWMKIPF